MSGAPLLVIDGDSLGHRAYHAMPPVPDAQRRPSGLLLGVANVIVSTYDLILPRAVLLALDSREPSYRHELLPGYQGQRPPFPADLREQLDALPELADAFGFVAAKVPSFEADDLLASGVERELAGGGSAAVMTSDRDAYQLVSDRSSVLVPSRGGKPPERVDEAGVVERYGVRAAQVPRADRAARRPVGRHPRRAGQRRGQRRRPAAALRHARGRDRARGRAEAAPTRVGHERR